MEQTDKQRLFLSWAHADAALKSSLLEHLKPNLRILQSITPCWWEDSDIATGERWRASILGRIADCDFGVHLVSPHFLASQFIVDREIPPFFGLDSFKPAFPVGLSPVSFDPRLVKTAGLSDHQIFLHRGKFFSELRGSGRAEFARQLAASMRDRILGEDPWLPRLA